MRSSSSLSGSPSPPEARLGTILQGQYHSEKLLGAEVLGRALEALHAARLVHGDLRPENVLLVDPEARGPYAGRALLVGHALHHLRRRDGVVGVDRLRYCPPELLAGEAQAAGPPGDVF